MSANFEVVEWPELSLPDALQPLLAEAKAAGFAWMETFVPAWTQAPFRGAGEALFLAQRNGALLGMAALSKDGLVHDPDTGRLRYIFISASARRLGIAEALVSTCLTLADTRWRRLTLHTDNPVAEAIYLRHGFMPVDAPGRTTHHRFNPRPAN